MADLYKDDTTFECAVKHSTGLMRAAAALCPGRPEGHALQCEVLWGESGTGKTRAAFLRDPKLFQLQVPNAHSGALWFDGYAGERTVLIDEYQGWIGFPLLKKLMDPWYSQDILPTKGSGAKSRIEMVIICSNHHPFRWHQRQTIGHLRELTRRITRAWRCRSDRFELVDLEAERKLLEGDFGANNEVPYAYNCD